MFEGFGENLFIEIKKISLQTMKVKIIASPNIKYAVRIDGSTLSLSNFAGI
jgi:actin-related protein